MRVLDTITGQFVWIDPKDSEKKYAILSHTWDKEGEQTYQELREIQKRYAPEHCLRDPPSPAPQQQHQAGLSFPLSPSGPLDIPSPPHPRRTSPPSEPPHDSYSMNGTVTPGLGIVLPSDTSSSQLPSHPIWYDRDLSSKIREACRIAREKGYRYLWVDSCCIDKTSSSELSESINSMYQWYALADRCYAFLVGVPTKDDHERKHSSFRNCLWFTRGWTLQELIAPAEVVFLSADWSFIGTKHSLATLVSEITNISYNALLHFEPLEEFSVAQRLSWGSMRQTARVEDRAYSLLGIFDINMPTIYGEGNRAFRRLQEEILRRIPDQSLFAWTSFSILDPPFQLHELEPRDADESQASRMTIQLHDHLSFLAPSLDFFGECAGIEAVSHNEVIRRLRLHTSLAASNYEVTPYGIRTQLPMIQLSGYLRAGPDVGFWARLSDWEKWYLAVLGCEHKDFPGRLLGRICFIQSFNSNIAISYLSCGRVCVPPSPGTSQEHPQRNLDLLPLSSAVVEHFNLSEIEYKTLYLPHPGRDEVGAFNVASRKPHKTINLVLLKKTCDVLYTKGYKADLRRPDGACQTGTHSLRLSNLYDTHSITIDYHHTLTRHSADQKLTITVTAHVQDAPSLRYSHHDTASGTVSGPYEWTITASLPWDKVLGNRGVLMNLGEGKPLLTMTLNLTFATQDHYIIHVDFETCTKSDEPGVVWIVDFPSDFRAENKDTYFLPNWTFLPHYTSPTSYEPVFSLNGLCDWLVYGLLWTIAWSDYRNNHLF